MQRGRERPERVAEALADVVGFVGDAEAQKELDVPEVGRAAGHGREVEQRRRRLDG